ncbi:hypothetical protein MVEN_01886800 [Mycena venus]|uniref:Uncharacterized protein n=1 Tax=Mycena venus TaxID=2733690 RepID=A0A8H6XJD1_9AGAR|nr:hypothetical protein MVEN_01886800 [Mycena venus]
MLPWFALFAISLLLPIPQASTKTLIPRDSCDQVCTPIADVDPSNPNSHICTDSVILQVAQCNDCEGQLSLDGSGTDNYDELQGEVDSFVSSCNIAGFKVKNITVKGSFTGSTNSSASASGSQSAGNATVTNTAAGSGSSQSTKPNGSSSSNGKLGTSMLLALILGALGSAVL